MDINTDRSIISEHKSQHNGRVCVSVCVMDKTHSPTIFAHVSIVSQCAHYRLYGRIVNMKRLNLTNDEQFNTKSLKQIISPEWVFVCLAWFYPIETRFGSI